MATKIIYVRLTEELHRRLEEIMREVPGEKSTVVRFLLERAIDEYERRMTMPDSTLLAAEAVAQM